MNSLPLSLTNSLHALFNTNLMQQWIQTMKLASVSMVRVTHEHLLHASELVVVILAAVVNHEVTQAVAVNLRPLSQLHEHDSDGISNHLHAYTFCCSLQHEQK